MGSIRQEKVGSLIHREIATIFQQEGHGLLEGRFVTVTVVRVSGDLGLAKVYLSFFQTKDKVAALESVRNHASQLRGMLGRRLGKQLRSIPELAFYIDDSLDRAEHIDELLKH